MVACGSADGYFEYGIHCWDIAAGVVIIREAGGVAVYPTGEYTFAPRCIGTMYSWSVWVCILYQVHC